MLSKHTLNGDTDTPGGHLVWFFTLVEILETQLQHLSLRIYSLSVSLLLKCPSVWPIGRRSGLDVTSLTVM